MQRRVAEGSIGKEDVAVYFVSRTDPQARLEPLVLNDDGEIENWPDNFFGDEMTDVAARVRAAMERRRKASASTAGA